MLNPKPIPECVWALLRYCLQHACHVCGKHGSTSSDAAYAWKLSTQYMMCSALALPWHKVLSVTKHKVMCIDQNMSIMNMSDPGSSPSTDKLWSSSYSSLKGSLFVLPRTVAPTITHTLLCDSAFCVRYHIALTQLLAEGKRRQKRKKTCR